MVKDDYPSTHAPLALARAWGNERFGLDDVRTPLLAPVLSATKPRNGYFLRAESFFNIAEFVDGDRFAPDLSLYGDVPLHAQSHGESFLALAANRFGADGVYLLDEPEAALSVTGALALLALVIRAAQSGAQFVIAPHSPILLAAPGARIYELDEDGINIIDYNDLQAVRLMRGFLDAPDRYLRQIMDEDAGAGATTASPPSSVATSASDASVSVIALTATTLGGSSRHRRAAPRSTITALSARNPQRRHPGEKRRLRGEVVALMQRGAHAIGGRRL